MSRNAAHGSLPPGPAHSQPLTLGDALASLGHTPHPECPAAAPGLTPEVWLVRKSTVEGSPRLLIVDLGESTPPGFRFLRALNRCTRPDRIRVVLRRREDRGRARALLPHQPPAPRTGAADGAEGGRADPGASR